jgi:hypothetical protein
MSASRRSKRSVGVALANFWLSYLIVVHNCAPAGQSGSMSDELTDPELDEIAARAEASLPGPWEALVEGRDHLSGDDFIRTGGPDRDSPDLYVTLSLWSDEVPKPASAAVLDFIATARQDVPRLVAEVRRLRRDRQ